MYAQASELNGQLTLDMELRIWRLLCWVLVQYSLTMSSFFPFGMVMHMPHHNILEVYFLKKMLWVRRSQVRDCFEFEKRLLAFD